MIKTRRKTSFFDVAFTLLLVVFFFVSLFTCGSFVSTGDSAMIQSDENHLAVFNVKDESKANVKSLYLNIGSVAAKEGEEHEIIIKTAVGKSSTPGSSFSANSGKTKYIVGQNVAYNWLEITSNDEEGKNIGSFSIKSNVSFMLNEIVGVSANGDVVSFTVNKTQSKEYVHPEETLGGAVDAPKSFSLKEAARHTYTNQESRMMSAIDNMLLGKSFMDGFVYQVDTGAGVLATAIYLPGVALFGHSVGALRVTSVLLTTATLAFSYLFIKLLCKDDKSGFIATLLFVLSSLPFTAGKLGSPFAILSCALIASAYFMLRFFSHSIHGKKVKTSALNVLYSGLLAAVAIATHLTAILPVLGILVLFFFGLRRQCAAHALTLSEIPQDDEEAIHKETATARYKNKIACGYAIISFVVGSLVFILLGGVLGYNSLVRAYDNPAEPTLGFLTLLAKSTGAASIGFANPFILVCPLARLHIVQSGNAYFTAFFNPVVLITAMLCFLYAIALTVLSFVKKADDKASKRLRRITVILTACLAASLLQATLLKELSLIAALPAALSLIAFIPLSYRVSCGFGRKGKIVADITLCVIVVLAAVFFLLTLAQIFGFTSPVFILLK